LIERGDVSTMSFGFYPIEVRDTTLTDGTIRSELLNVDLIEVSFGVSTPAYEDSTSKIRSDTNNNMETRKLKTIILRQLDLEMLAQLMEQETLSQEEVDFLTQAADDIKAYAESKAQPVDNQPTDNQPTDTTTQTNSADVEETEKRNRLALILDLEEKE